MIQWTLSLDGVVTSASVMAVLALIWRLSARFTTIEDQIKVLSADADKIAGAVTTIAVQAKRLDHLEEMVRELRHGEGMVLPLRKSPYEASR